MNAPIFMRAEHPAQLLPSSSIFTRGLDLTQAPDALIKRVAEIERAGGSSADVMSLLSQFATQVGNVERALNASNAPVRENLEAEAKILVPMETPLRNKLPRRSGSGVASQWKQLVSLGGGYGAATTTSGAGNAIGNATVVVTSAAGLQVGDQVIIGTGGTAEVKTITSIAGTTIGISPVLVAAQNSQPFVKIGTQPGGGSAVRSFYGETGAPAEYTSVYASKLLAYKFLGAMGSVTGFAMAAGASFQNQLATEKTNGLRNAMLNEENALINADSASLLAPWGDGTTAYAYDGLLKQIGTANGTPVQNIQTNVGPLTTAHLDAQITRLWLQGAQGIYMLLNGQEIQSLARIAQQGGSYRIMIDQRSANLGAAVTGYIHPVTGEVIPILPERFVSPGTIIFGCDRLPDGSPAADVDVLPQVQLPELAPNDMVQGYVAQELAPSASAPQVYPFMVSVFSVLRVKSALHFAKSTGVTPAA